MFELSAIARPYAQAAFDFAVGQEATATWSQALHFLASMIENADLRRVLDNPMLGDDQVAALLLDVGYSELDQYHCNFVKTLASKQRLVALPQIAKQFDALKAQYEQVIDAEVYSVQPLGEPYQERLVQALSKQFNKTVKLTCQVDKTLIGGVVIRAGDRVIDNSVRGQFERMKAALEG